MLEAQLVAQLKEKDIYLYCAYVKVYFPWKLWELQNLYKHVFRQIPELLPGPLAWILNILPWSKS